VTLISTSSQPLTAVTFSADDGSVITAAEDFDSACTRQVHSRDRVGHLDWLEMIATFSTT